MKIELSAETKAAAVLAAHELITSGQRCRVFEAVKDCSFVIGDPVDTLIGLFVMTTFERDDLSDGLFDRIVARFGPEARLMLASTTPPEV